MTSQNSLKKNTFDMLQVLFGTILSAFSIACFALPYNMVVSGLAGIGRVLNHYTGVSVSIVVYAISISLFVLGALTLGRKFALSIIIGSFAYPFFFDMFQRMTFLHHLVEDPLLAAIVAGIVDGVGMGIILRAGGSTGGIDVPAIVCNKYLGWKIAPIVYVIDLAIFISQIALTDTNGIILGALYALLYTLVMNRIIVMDQGGVQLMIFSEKSEEINEALLQRDFGTTLLKGTGGYLHDDREVIYCVASSRYLNMIKRAVLAIDPKAFITISNVSEINGNGFTSFIKDEVYVKDLMERSGTAASDDKY